MHIQYTILRTIVFLCGAYVRDTVAAYVTNKRQSVDMMELWIKIRLATTWKQNIRHVLPILLTEVIRNFDD